MSEQQQTSQKQAPPRPAGAGKGMISSFIALATAGADYVFPLNAATQVGQLKTRGFADAALVTLDNGRVVLRLASGNPEAPSWGQPGGYSIRVSDPFEAAASGNPIKISVTARTADGAASGQIAICYSTNDAGNSGWRWFRIGPEWRVLQMEFNVPRMRVANGDFIGLLPDSPGTAAVEIAAVAVKVSAAAKPAAVIKSPQQPQPAAKPALPKSSASLPDELLKNAKLVSRKHAILSDLPKGKVFAEVGVALGDYTKSIFDACAPQKLYAFDHFAMHRAPKLQGKPAKSHFGDKTHEEFYRDKFGKQFQEGVLEIYPGESLVRLAELPDHSIDALYLSSCQSYAETRDHLELVKDKIAPAGTVIVNNYIFFDHLKSNFYGVVQATNEFMIENGWEMTHFALSPQMFCNVAIRPQSHSIPAEPGDQHPRERRLPRKSHRPAGRKVS